MRVLMVRVQAAHVRAPLISGFCSGVDYRPLQLLASISSNRAHVPRLGFQSFILQGFYSLSLYPFANVSVSL
jgi:hypothetical protein